MTTPPNGVPVSLVTGANKGIGLQTVRRLLGAGHHVYLAARDPERGRAAAKALGARFVQLDVTSDDSVRRAADLVEQEEGHLDVLVNNAGITGPVRNVHEYDGDDLAAVVMTNVVGYVRVIHAFLPLLERSSDPRNAADPGMTATDLSGGQGHSVNDGTDAIIAFALGGPDTPTGAYRDRTGDLPWQSSELFSVTDRFTFTQPISKGSTMYLITGSTGNIGRPLVEQLHREGHDVRALVRDPSRADLLPNGTEIAVGNLDDADSVAAALRGVDSVFLLHTGPGTTQTQIMIDAARSAGVDRIVLLSSIGARLIPLGGFIPGTLAAREDLLRASGLDVTYLRPNGLMSNAVSWADGIRKDSRVIDATDPGTQPVVDPADIARVAALVLTADGHVGHGYILNGPEALTAREQVQILSHVLGRTIDFVDVTPKQLAQDSIELGTPVQLAEATQHLNELFRAGRAGVIADDIENLTGVAPRTFRDWCERHVDEFR